MSGLGSLYGTHHFLWYVYAGIPAICGAITPLFLLEIYSISTRGDRTKARIALIGIIASYAILHSFSEHKEFRFLLPILPLIMVLAGHAMASLLYATTDVKSLNKLKFVALIAIILLNFPHLLYLGTFHQRGPIAMNKYFMDKIATSMYNKQIHIHYLMGCHSAPLYSHLHIPHVSIQAWHLDCSPECRSNGGAVCESDAFLLDPTAFITAAYDNESESSGFKVCDSREDGQCSMNPNKNIPTFIAMMQDDAAKTSYKLKELGMSHVASIKHTINALAWHQSNNSNCDFNSDEISICHNAFTILSLVDVHFEHMEVYQSNRVQESGDSRTAEP